MVLKEQIKQHGDLLVRQLQDLEHIFIVRFPVLIMTETMIRIRLRLVEISRQASMLVRTCMINWAFSGSAPARWGGSCGTAPPPPSGGGRMAAAGPGPLLPPRLMDRGSRPSRGSRDRGSRGGPRLSSGGY